MRSLLIGAKMGDFIHALVLPKYLNEQNGERFNIYITERAEIEKFGTSLTMSYTELFPIVSKQKYVNNFQIWDGEPIDYDLTTFRNFDNLFDTSWNEFYLWNYIGSHIEVPFNYSWIDVEKNDMYKNTLLINRNYGQPVNNYIESHYLNYIKAYKDRAFFVCSNTEQYTSSSFNGLIPMIYLPNLKDMVTAISSCDHFLGNFTGTSAIATALNTPRTVEVNDRIDRRKYIIEMRNYNNLSCFG